jgi:hypothetical protein
MALAARAYYCAHVDVERAMRILFLAAAILPLAACSTAAGLGGPNPRDPDAKAPAVAFTSAFEGYRPFTEQETQDWRKANDEVHAAGGHAGHRPGQGPGQPTSKPEPGKPESSGGHGAHK